MNVYFGVLVLHPLQWKSSEHLKAGFYDTEKTYPLVCFSCLRQFLLTPSGWLPNIWLIAPCSCQLHTVWNWILFPQFVWVCCLLAYYAWNLIHLCCKKLRDRTFLSHYVLFIDHNFVWMKWNSHNGSCTVAELSYHSVFCQFDLFYLSIYSCCDDQSCFTSYS